MRRPRQSGEYPAASILAAVERKDPNEIDDETLILADLSRKAQNQVSEVRELMGLYPQPRNRRPSVEYIPAPYGEPRAPERSDRGPGGGPRRA
jgi:hypothetical protein